MLVHVVDLDPLEPEAEPDPPELMPLGPLAPLLEPEPAPVAPELIVSDLP